MQLQLPATKSQQSRNESRHRASHSDLSQSFENVMKPSALKEITKQVNQEDSLIHDRKRRPEANLWGDGHHGNDMIDDLDEIQLIDAELAPQKQVVGRLKQAEVASNEDNMFNFTHQKVQIPKLDENDDFDEIDQIA